jgi:hypothetical protein
MPADFVRMRTDCLSWAIYKNKSVWKTANLIIRNQIR